MSHRLALLVGNNDYNDASLAKLVSPPHDIVQLGELLRDSDIGGFDQVDILENQSFATVRRAIASFFNQKKRDDLLVLYFSGHGVLDENGQLYLAVQDTERSLLSATAIEATFITSVDTASTFEGKGYGRIVLTASDATQYAWDGDDLVGEAQTSVFTRYLVEGLRSGDADADADGLITLDELYDYVYERVVTETPRQTPAKWSYKQQGTIVLARNPQPDLKPAPLPEELLRAIESPFAGIRQGAVHDLQRMLGSSDRGLAYAAQLTLQEMVDDDSRAVSAAARTALAEAGTSQAETPSLTGQEPPGMQPASSPVAAPFIPPSTTSDQAPPASGSKSRSGQRTISRVIKNPIGFVAAGWSVTWIASLVFAQLTNRYEGFMIAWILGGLITGMLLFQQKKSGRGLFASALAAIWSLPLLCFLVFGVLLDNLGINISTSTFVLIFITGSFSLIGLGSSLAILYYQRIAPPQDED